MEKNVNKRLELPILVTAGIFILLFGVILFVFNKIGYLSFKKNDSEVITNTNNNCDNECFDTSISDYDTIQEVNKFWNKLLGKWSNGFYGIEFSTYNGIPYIISGKHYYESSSGIVVSIEKEKDNVYTFNVVSPMYSRCNKEVCNKTDEMQLYIDEGYYELVMSYTIDVSNLDKGTIKYISQYMWSKDEDALFNRVND